MSPQLSSLAWNDRSPHLFQEGYNYHKSTVLSLPGFLIIADAQKGTVGGFQSGVVVQGCLANGVPVPLYQLAIGVDWLVSAATPAFPPRLGSWSNLKSIEMNVSGT